MRCSYSLFKLQKLEWQSLSVDLLPHPDMFTDARFNSSSSKDNRKDDDGAKRLFFGGERFLEGISGEANVSKCFFFQLLLMDYHFMDQTTYIFFDILR